MSSNAKANEGIGSYDNPVASVAEATRIIENQNDNGKYARDYEINFLPGIYNNPIKLMGFNNGNLIVNGENAVIKGSIPINKSDFEKVNQEDILDKIPEKAQGNIYRVNLCEKKYVESTEEEFRIFTKDGICNIARYPNDDGIKSSADFMTTGKVINNSFSYSDPRGDRWGSATDAYVYGMFRYDYFNDRYKVDVNTVDKVISVETNGDEILSDKPFYIYNLIEELDAEDEYFFDKKSGYLYVCCPDIENENYEISLKNNSAIVLENCHNVTLSGFVIENSYSDLIKINKGENVLIQDCEIRNGFSKAVRVTNSDNSAVNRCNIYNIGGGGIYLEGGNRTTLIGGKNVVKNCVIHDYQLFDREYTGAVNLIGTNHIVNNNHIYNGYSMAINMYGNNHLIENNDIHNVCEETNDMGAVYSHGDWSFRGNAINHNYFHDLKSFELGVNAIYLDHGVSGTSITNNIFENVTKISVNINGGRDNIIKNNLFIKNGDNECLYGVAISDILNWSGSYENQCKPSQDLVDKLYAVNYKSQYYSKYKHLANILEDEPMLPKYNVVEENMFIGISNPIPGDWLRTVNFQQLVNNLESVINNYQSDNDPGFYDMAKKDYSLKSDADIFRTFPNFKEVTLENIGP